jgi:hypothetical protein
MSIPNKYHSSGRMYTARESIERRRALAGAYVHAQPKAYNRPYDEGRNAKKRMARTLGYKSLKQWERH